jgi:O-antigen/teichoic acid export membrane protein
MTFRSFVTQKLGVDKAIFFTLLSRGLSISTALFTVFFIAKNLSPEEQGFYYTFGSIVALQVFFELGLTGIITQFVAHEASHLRLNADCKMEGDELYRSRLSSLLKFCAKWYLIIAALVVVALGVFGSVFFARYSEEHKDIEWFLPWILLAVGTAFNLLLSPITAFLEGLGKVKEVAQLRFVQQIVHPVVVWGGLCIGGKLFVSGADAFFRVFVVMVIIAKSPFFKILKNIWNDLGKEKVLYMKEIFPYQWRIALSWVSGYFIFQLFNPVLFATEGAKVAGQMGMTLAALNGIQSLTLSWINTKVPKMSGLIAHKDYSTLDSLFYITKRQILLIGTFSLLFLVFVIYFIQIKQFVFLGIEIGSRFLPIKPLCLMAWASWTMLPINCWAIYLRCHKKEPLLQNSVVVGILCCISTIGLGHLYGLYGMTLGFALLRFISLTWIYTIYKIKKEEWHGK